ncbi:hypothetical protein BQ8482_111242 [Mesorhizobium delmotii]|uniref:Short-chain dehydrogenase/reductase SDR n=1 Tax=Mesorhizobium delmotii TaxID=1631247 RepID=A0A2P9ADX7_9HYPH|nr:hypothetical protein BQ8482_111242 [Mesorhizobium delmotii]
MTSDVAIIAGAGPGLSASLARLLAKEGFRVVLAARNVGKLSTLVDETGALAVVDIGMMCCSPQREGFEITFSDFSVGPAISRELHV